MCCMRTQHLSLLCLNSYTLLSSRNWKCVENRYPRHRSQIKLQLYATSPTNRPQPKPKVIITIVKKNLKLWQTAGCEAKVITELSSHPKCTLREELLNAWTHFKLQLNIILSDAKNCKFNPALHIKLELSMLRHCNSIASGVKFLTVNNCCWLHSSNSTPGILHQW